MSIIVSRKRKDGRIGHTAQIRLQAAGKLIYSESQTLAGKPVAVLNHNKAAFYMVEPALFEAMLKELSDQDLHKTVLSRMEDRSRAIEVDIDVI